VAISADRIGASAGSRASSATARRSTWVTTNSRSSRAVHSLLSAERNIPSAAAPAGESQTLSTRAISRSPACSRGPASAAGTSSAGSTGEFMHSRNSFSFVPK
jgi:hypothetical protein